MIDPGFEDRLVILKSQTIRRNLHNERQEICSTADKIHGGHTDVVCPSCKHELIIYINAEAGLQSILMKCDSVCSGMDVDSSKVSRISELTE